MDSLTPARASFHHVQRFFSSSEVTKPNRGSARNMHDVQNLGNHLKLERTIPLKKSNALSTQTRKPVQDDSSVPRAVQPHHSDESNHPMRPARRLFPDVRSSTGSLASCGKLAVQPHLPVRDDHKYDQQHQQNIDQRDYIYIRDVSRLYHH